MSHSILLVDDEENDVFFMVEAFKRAGITNYQIVRDGQQALDYLRGEGKYADRAQFPMPALALLDLKLPFVMGLDVLRKIRERPGGPIVIILSASSDPTDISNAYAAGANAYLVKPSSVEGLFDLVKCMKEFWLTHNVVPHVRRDSIRS
ncbi:MAG TPA: response regulator [Verrucomicrobiae bacterium]|jgi:CheY-like chemotaxis protein